MVGLGTYSREFAREVRAAAALYGIEALITDDYLTSRPPSRPRSRRLVLGTQMERNIAKRLGIACAVISAPVHVQDFPARYSPQMGFEGANVMFDSFVHPLMMGLEEHLLGMFREDFEFHDGRGRLASRPWRGEERAAAAGRRTGADPSCRRPPSRGSPTQASRHRHLDAAAAEQELRKIPFFVRGKARRNTERFAAERGVAPITVETLYDAKAHFGR